MWALYGHAGRVMDFLTTLSTPERGIQEGIVKGTARSWVWWREQSSDYFVEEDAIIHWIGSPEAAKSTFYFRVTFMLFGAECMPVYTLCTQVYDLEQFPIL
jgi:hypothetical protein